MPLPASSLKARLSLVNLKVAAPVHDPSRHSDVAVSPL